MQEEKAKQITCKGRTVTLNPSLRCAKVNVIIIKGRNFYRILIGQIGTSLVVQWLRIHLPMQGTQV